MVDIWTFIIVSIPVMLLLGVRHAFDVDHITAIDNLVRLHNATKKSRWVGAGFSIGHMISMLVEMLFIIMIVGSVTATENIAFWGGLIGITSLGIIGTINIYAMKKWGKTGSGILAGKVLNRTGMLRPFSSSLVTGMVFGLGFDTATQISAITISAIASATLGVQTALILAGFFAIGMIPLDTLNSTLLRSAFSRIIGTNGFKRMSYGLSGVAMVVASIATYEIITNTEILPDWAGPSLAGGVIASSFAYSFLTHS
jgi:high-affinity nickel-transport protein